MRIAVYITAVPEGGGYFQYILTILSALATLDETKHVVKVWFTHDAWLPILEKLTLPNKKATPSMPLRVVDRLSSLLGRFLPTSLKELALRLTYPSSEILMWKPADVLIPQPCVLFLPQKIRQLSVVHDLMHIYEPSFSEVGAPAEIKFREYLFSNIVKRCSIILADSPLGKKHIQESYGALTDQVHVFPFVATESLLNCTPQKMDIMDNIPKFILYPAQFWEHKNHHRLLLALRESLTEEHDMVCVLTGSTQYEGYNIAKRTIKEFGLENNVVITGYIKTEHLAWLYRKALCLVMPTLFGPTNIPPLEAMAMGLPMAVSDIYDMRWQCGDAALYFDPTSVDKIARCLKFLWTNDTLRATLRKKGLARYETWNSNTARVEFKKILTYD